jgi:hypothetical protein
MDFEFIAGQEGEKFYTEVSSDSEDFEPDQYSVGGAAVCLSLEQVDALVNVVEQLRLECRRLGSGPLGMGDGPVLSDLSFNISNVFVGIDGFKLELEGADKYQSRSDYEAKTCLCAVRDGGEQVDFSKTVATIDGSSVQLLVSFPAAMLTHHLEMYASPGLGMR